MNHHLEKQQSADEDSLADIHGHATEEYLISTTISPEIQQLENEDISTI